MDAVRQVMRDIGGDKREVEIKKYAKVEKIPGGAMDDCRVISGVMFTKDVVNPDRMRRKIDKPRILLLDCPVEYKKGENQTAVELCDEADFAELLQQEEEARPPRRSQRHPALLCSAAVQPGVRTARAGGACATASSRRCARRCAARFESIVCCRVCTRGP